MQRRTPGAPGPGTRSTARPVQPSRSAVGGFPRPGGPETDGPEAPGRDPRMAARRGLGAWAAVVTAVRTPFLLFRFPGILFAVVLAAAILGVATAASPLFLSSAATAAVRQVTSATGNVPALSLSTYSTIASDVAAYRNRLLRQTTAHVHGLGAPVATVLGGRQQVANPRLGPTAQTPTVVVATRTGAEWHLRFVAGAPRPDGVWVADVVARALRLHAGDTVRIGSAPTATATVAGIYRALADLPQEAYWVPISGFVYPQSPSSPTPPPLLLSSVQEFDRIEGILQDQGQYRWDFALARTDLTLPQAERLSNQVQRVIVRVSDPSTEVGSAFVRPASTSPLPSLVQQATQTVVALTGPVDTLAVAGRVVALAVVAAAGLFLVSRRRVEFTFLNARGVGPVRIAGRSVVEAILPAAAGAAAGWYAGTWLVRALGPTGTVTPDAVGSAARQVAWSAGVAVLFLGAVAAVAVRSESEARTGGRLRTVAARFPWEVVVLALAAASYYEVATRGTAPVAQGGPPKVDRLLLLFPILFIAGLAGVAVRILRGYLPRLRSVGARLPAAPYLAIRRLGSVPKLATSLVTATALGVGILVFAGVFTDSVRTTANTKALVSVGSDVAVTVGAPPTLRDEPFPATATTRLTGSSLEPGGIEGDVLAIDPETFARASFWDSSFSGTSEQDLLALLTTGGAGRLPVVLAGGDRSGPGVLSVQGIDLPVDVVGRATTFPGMPPGRALIVAAEGPLSRALSQAGTSLGAFQSSYQVWVKGDPARLLPLLRQRGFPVELAITADQVRQTPSFLALSWIFGFLESLGVLAGLVGLVALVLYLQARVRSREVAYALSRRMGLRRLSSFLSVALELAGMLLAAFVIGAGLAVGAAFLLYRKADPMPDIPPAPLLRVPMALFLVTAAALVVAAFVAAWRVQRQAERANVAEVMRLAGN
jgi:putative ABC transport system permease protein